MSRCHDIVHHFPMYPELDECQCGEMRWRSEMTKPTRFNQMRKLPGFWAMVLSVTACCFGILSLVLLIIGNVTR